MVQPWSGGGGRRPIFTTPGENSQYCTVELPKLMKQSEAVMFLKPIPNSYFQTFVGTLIGQNENGAQSSKPLMISREKILFLIINDPLEITF